MMWRVGHVFCRVGVSECPCNITVRHSNLWLCISIVFLVCRKNCKANGVANNALLAKRCLIKCIGFVETPDIISGCVCNTGCRPGFE